MKNLRIGIRLTTGFISVLILMVIMALTSCWLFYQVDRETTNMVNDVITSELASKDWLANTRLNGERAYVVAVGINAQDEAEISKKMRETTAAINEIQKKLQSRELDENEKKMLADIQENRQQYISIRSDALKLKTAGKTEEALTLIRGTMVPAFNTYVESIDKFTQYQHQTSEKTARYINELYRNSLMILGLLTSAAVLLGLIIAWRLTLGITRPLNQALHVAQTVADGDLTSQIAVNSNDETGKLMQALKNMNESLLHIVSDVRSSADTISTAASEIASGNQDLSSRTEEQASALEETASSMEELTSTVRQNGDNARQAEQLANAATDIAIRGGEANERVVKTMQEIDESARKIEEIIGVIDGIAFQTNLLALNAAVEAARAGEQGRGFAVVASEVRNLAQRTAEAAREIKGLIADSVEKVTSGSALVQETSQTMQEVVTSIQRVDDIMREINMATQEQVQGIEQVNQAVVEMDTVSQQNAALVEEAAAAAESLQEQSRHLVEAMSVFRTNGSSASQYRRQQPVALIPSPSAVRNQRHAIPALAATGRVSSHEEEMEEF